MQRIWKYNRTTQLRSQYFLCSGRYRSRLHETPITTSLQCFSSFLSFQDNSENIDFRDYLLCAIFINQSNVPGIQLLESISKVRVIYHFVLCDVGLIYKNFQIYETKVDSAGQLNHEGLFNVMQHAMPLSNDDCAVIFNQIDKRNQKLISFCTFGLSFIHMGFLFDHFFVRR